jgi:hypothetical protein
LRTGAYPTPRRHGTVLRSAVPRSRTPRLCLAVATEPRPQRGSLLIVCALAALAALAVADQDDSLCIDYNNCTAATASSGTAPTGDAVADYQIVLWTSVLLALVAIGSVSAMLGVGGGGGDPALFVQLTDDRAR